MTKPVIQEFTTLPKGEDENSRIIKAISPLSLNIMVPKALDDSYSVLARVTWLCKDVEGYLFCLTSTYVSESDEDDEFLALSPLSSERYFCNYNITADLLASSLPHYLTDLDFKFKYPDKVHRSNETEIYCQAFEQTEDENGNATEGKLHKIMVSPEVYSTLKYMDTYFLDGVTNNGELHSAIVLGADETNNTFIFEPDIVEVVDAAMIDKTSLMVRVKLYHTGKSQSSVELMMLTGLDKTSSKIIKKEIRKKDPKAFSDEYMKKDENQFIQRYSFSSNVSETDEVNFLFVKAVNIKKDGLLIALRPDVQPILTNKIAEFVYKSN